jgi:hypothetical protein
MRKEEIIEYLLRDFPSTEGKQINIYFTDVFDIGETDDTTTDELIALYSQAIHQPFFDCIDL